MTGQALSEVGKRNFGRPTCIAIAASIVLGTSRGMILVFDYNQNLKSIIGPGTKALESGSITSISISADHSTIAAGHSSGSIFTWEVAKSAKPFLHISPIDRSKTANADGHVLDVAILHIGFLGMRHTALASADDQGMAFSHLATRGMGAVGRSVKTTRILGRYPDGMAHPARQRKPSSVLSFMSLPLGNAEHTADSMGLVALLTPYLLVVVSTTPIAQTQFKTPRPKEVTAHGALTAALAWFPSVRLKKKDQSSDDSASRVKLVYCWSNILTVLDIIEAEPSATASKDETPILQFNPRSRWKSEEAIVGVQWLGRSVLAVLTITQQLIILEDPSMLITDSSDLIQKHIYHADLFSPQLNQLVDQLEDEEVAGMHGVVADAFHMSFRAYKGRLFLLGFNEVSFGTLSNWADRLLALMEDGNYIGAIQLATSYYNGQTNKAAVGLPEDDDSRHKMVKERLTGMMEASLNYAFGKSKGASETRIDSLQMTELSSACIAACKSMDAGDYLFDEVYEFYQESGLEHLLIESLEPYIIDDDIVIVPPVVIKDLVNHYTKRGLNDRLEEILCHVDPRALDIDQVTALCKSNHLFDALLYIWSQALGDYTTIICALLDLAESTHSSLSENYPIQEKADLTSASKVFPYLSYILTGRIYPSGKSMHYDSATLAKAEIYHFFFPKSVINIQSSRSESSINFPNLRRILDFDAPSFLSMLNEAFEDPFLNGPQEHLAGEMPGQLSEEQKFGLSVNRQWIVSILLEVMVPPEYEPNDTIYLNMFVARNLPKFQQFILLPGQEMHRVFVGLCQYPSEELADDCQLSVEYLLSIYEPPDLSALIPLISNARFYRVLKSTYKAEMRFAELLQTCFEDHDNTSDIFDCIRDCLKPNAGLNEKQIDDVRRVIIDHARELVTADFKIAALTIDQYAPDLHCICLDSVREEDSVQFEYLQTILEPQATDPVGRSQARNRNFVEQYVRLLCVFNPLHVGSYIEQLQSGDLRLNEVLPALEDCGVIDAAVILMAREGKVREGIDRLIKHLGMLESILLGLLDRFGDSTDIVDTAGTGQDLADSIQKYARVGSWLCQKQSKAVEKSKARITRGKNADTLRDVLSPDEELWLDLIDAVVKVTKNVTEVLERQERHKESKEDPNLCDTISLEQLDPSKIITGLRTVVQEIFTSLLTATSAPHKEDTYRSDASFLKILRAFLNRASLSSPSLSNLRAVLATIFSAYSYEEALLSLTNRLLDKDIFVHVTKADTLRRRGWRPLGQVCEGCGSKIWGPGAGGFIWDAWQKRNDEGDLPRQERRGSRVSRSSSKEGKGKAATKSNDQPATMEPGSQSGPETHVDQGPVVIFSCRHMFHRTCLEAMRDRGAPTFENPDSDLPDPDLICLLCK